MIYLLSNYCLRFGLLCSILLSVCSFAPPLPPTTKRCHLPPQSLVVVLSKSHPNRFSSVRLWESNSEDSGESGDASVEAPAPPPQPVEPPNPYPINLPSPLLLSTSMVLAIASTGSLFELLGGATPPPLGVPATAAIVVVGLPVSLFLFYASILKATAETEEDDKQFLGKS